MEKQWLLIENKGEIDINALILMGGSTKRDSETAIGFFGSGWKYTIALMLKKGIEFCIYSGINKVEVTTKNVKFRDKEFDQILINGQDTSLTTDMGPQWDSWMAVREVVSNSIDEGESNIISATEDLNAKEGHTRIYINHHSDIVEVVKNWDKYFSFDRTDCLIDVHGDKLFQQMDTEKESVLWYRKGIQCYYVPTSRSLFNYDIASFKINESRVVSDNWDARRDITKFLCSHANKQVAVQILGTAFVGERDYQEGRYDYSYWAGNKLCDSWREAIGDRIIINNDAAGFYMTEMGENKHYRVSREMAKAIKGSFPDVTVLGVGQDDDGTLNWKVINEPNSKIQYLLKKSLEFCRDTEFAVNYPVEVVEFDKPEVLGSIDKKKKTLLVAVKAFDNGMKDIVMTIMEESIHLQEGLHDETRAFEGYLIKQWLTEKELRFGVFL